jgi:nucleoside-diphosphate-sugar epimerase
MVTMVFGARGNVGRPVVAGLLAGGENWGGCRRPVGSGFPTGASQTATATAYGRRTGRPGVAVEDDHFFFNGPDVEQAIPYGIYDIARNTGWVNVDHDTSVWCPH